MSKALEHLKKWQGYILAVIFFAVLFGKLKVLWEIEDTLAEINETLTKLEARDNSIDFAYRDALCDMIELRNADCIYFEGATVVLVAPGGAAEIGN